MLRVVHGNRLDRLADRLIASLREAPPAPFAEEIVVVPSAALARWLGFRMAERLGIAGGIRYPFPAAYVWSLFADVLPSLPRESPFEPGLMTWRLARLLATVPEGAAFAPVRRYLRDGSVGPRVELARVLAEQYETYAAYRPQWLERWLAKPGALIGLGEHEAWQSALWRALAADQPGLPHRHPKDDFFATLERDPRARARLPARIALFGIDALAPLYLEVLTGLAKHIDVTVYLPNPCREYWGQTVRPARLARAAAVEAAQMTLDLASHMESGHPLLGALGQHGKTLFDELVTATDEFDDAFAPPARDTLLGALQTDILELAAAPEDEPIAIDEAHRSIEVHACHGPLRQAEALYDALLARFAADRTLAPEDVLILTPDIETFAPAIDAVFAAAPPARFIPFTIADRAGTAERPIVRSLATIVAVARGRLDAPSVLGLLEEPRIAARFDLHSVESGRLARWIAETGIRWGEDERSRAALGVSAPSRAFSWRAGLERLVLGAVMGDSADEPIGGTLPYADVEGAATRTLGALIVFFDALADLARDLTRARPIAAWSALAARTLDAFHRLDANDDDDAQALRQALAMFGAQAAAARFDEPVPIEVAWPAVERVLAGLARAQGFFAGGVTIARLAPGRIVPARVIGVVGLDDTIFPAADRPRGFDLTARHPLQGDRRRRDEDRYAFLSALTQAQDAFLAFFSGSSQREEAQLPPSTTLADLLAALGRRFTLGGDNARDAVTVRHPLAPGGAAYFDGRDARLATFASEWVPPREPPPPRPFAAGATLPRPEHREVTLDALARGLRAPAELFLRRRLELRLTDPEEALDAVEPFALDGLARYSVGAQLLHALTGRADLAKIERALTASGVLPAPPIGEAVLAAVRADAQRIAEAMGEGEPFGWLAPLRFEREIAGWRLSGRFDALTPAGQCLGRVGKLNARVRVDAWMRHVCLNVVRPADVALTTRLVGESTKNGKPTETCVFRPLTAELAERLLGDLLALYEEALGGVVPLFPETSLCYAEHARKGATDALDRARDTWLPNAWGNARSESELPYNALAMRDIDDPLDARFVALAERVFGPLLDASDASDASGSGDAKRSVDQ